MVSVRPAAEVDLNRMKQIRMDAIRGRERPLEPVSDARVDSLLARDESRVAVAEVDSAVVGWGAAYLDEAPVLVVYLDPGPSRSAARRAIIKDLEGIATEHGIESVPAIIL